MPRDKQIIPKYTYPHEEVYVNDNSAKTVSLASSDETIKKYLAVFASSRGRDNKLLYINSLSAYRTMFGNTNYAKYGQPHLMPEAYLSNTNTGVWCMRVMPEDATYANSVLSLWYKADVANQTFKIKFTAKSITEDYLATLGSGLADGLRDRDTIQEVGAMLDGTAVNGVYVDDEGYTQVPLATYTAAGRGVYGQNLRWRITTNQDYEKEYGAKFFTFEILDVTNEVSVVQSDDAMLVADPEFTEMTTFINDILEDKDEKNVIADIHVYDENVEALYEVYSAFCDECLAADPSLSITVPTLYEFDPLFGKELKVLQSRTPGDQPFISFVTELTADIDTTAADYNADDYTSTETVTIENVAGNYFENGSDGAFADGDETVRSAAIDAMYIEAFSGNLDKLILSCRRTPVDTLYDANYSLPVKMALARLALHRFDAILYLDTNFRESLGTTDIKTLESDFIEIDEMVDDYDDLSENWLVSLNTHDYYVKETSTAKRVRVTATYFLALSDPAYMRALEDGSIPRTGEDYSQLSGHIKNSLNPAIDESDKDIKQALTDAHVNFFEATGENVFVRATDHTYCTSTSDLGIEANVVLLLKWKRILESEFRKKRNQITTPQKRKDFRDYLLTKYEYLKGTWFNNMDILYKSNEYEASRRITHAYASVEFYPRGEITIIEIDVNPSEYEADIEDE